MSVTEFTAAISGSGKTYRRCAHFLATEFLPMRRGRIWTNFPIFVDKMLDDLAEHHPDLVVAELKERICLIPHEELKSWRAFERGPWDFFSDQDLEGDRIAIDEIHNYIPVKAPAEYARKWQEFLGELRHRGCEFEALSQYDTKVHKLIRDEAGLKRDLFNCESRRDPFFRVLMGDWYNLRASFITGEYTPSVFEFEYIPIQGKWKLSHQMKFRFEPRFFALYDSYSAPVAGGKKAKGPSHPYQEKTRLQLLWWFARRNWFNFSWRCVVIAVVFWLCFLGGTGVCLQGFTDLQKSIMERNTAPRAQRAPSSAASAPPAPAAASGAAPVPVTEDAMKRVLAQLEVERKRVAELTATVEALRRELDRRSEITLIGMNYAITRAGYYLQVGDAVPSGKHEGCKVVALDHKRRSVLLDSGVSLSLSR